MIINKPFIDQVIQDRIQEKDPVQIFATRNKASPLNTWNEFEPYSEQNFQKVFKTNIDGVKLKFKFVTLTINGRHKSI